MTVVSSPALGRQFQSLLQILFDAPARHRLVQRIVRHSKPAGRKQVLLIPVVLKCIFTSAWIQRRRSVNGMKPRLIGTGAAVTCRPLPPCVPGRRTIFRFQTAWATAADYGTIWLIPIKPGAARPGGSSCQSLQSVQPPERRSHGRWPDAGQAPMKETLAYKRGVICEAEANFRVADDPETIPTALKRKRPERALPRLDW